MLTAATITLAATLTLITTATAWWWLHKTKPTVVVTTTQKESFKGIKVRSHYGGIWLENVEHLEAQQPIAGRTYIPRSQIHFIQKLVEI